MMNSRRKSLSLSLSLSLSWNLRRLSTAVRQYVEDEGDWFYSSEWWGNLNDSNAHTVFRGVSDKGNGVVSVLAYPSSKPDRVYWAKTENWLWQRYTQINPTNEDNNHFRVLGYQWRTLHFNDHTRQSTAKIMAGCKESDPASLFFMQQAHCLAVPYVKSMISAGLATISCNYDIKSAILGKRTMNILCIGHGGGSIPLFLASQIQGALVHIVEIDPLVITASVEAMGFPSYAIMTKSGERSCPEPNDINKLLWKGIHERLLLYESDAEKFIPQSSTIYDIIFIDAYDGDDIFPHKLWDPHSPFLEALGYQLHPEHGTVIVNLHSDVDLTDDSSALPMGKYISKVCRAYKDVLLSNSSSGGLAYTVSVPWVCNTSLVVSRGFGKVDGWDMVLNSLMSKSIEVETILDLSFSVLPYIKRGFIPVF